MQPLSLATTREVAFYQRTVDYVSGSVVRGAIAAAWIRDFGPPSGKPEFAQVFEGRVRFEDALPVDFAVVPQSVVFCKYCPTDECVWFEDQAYEPRPHTHGGGKGEVGSCAACSQRQGQAKPALAAQHCRHCGGPLDRSKGQLVAPRVGMGAPETLPQAIQDLREVRVRTAVDPDTGSARERALFSREALAPRFVFEGRIAGLETLPDDVGDRFLRWLKSLRQLRVGKGRSVAGRVDIALEPEPERVPEPEELRPRPEPATGKATRSDGRRVLRLVSHAIVLDDFGRPTMDLTPELKRHGLGELKLLDHWARPVTVGGWHAASGLPKPTEHAICAGSTFILTVPAGSEEKLAALAAEGIGHRRREGFGRVQVDPPEWWPLPDSQTQPRVAQPEAVDRDNLAGVHAAVKALLDAIEGESDAKPDQTEAVNRVRAVLREVERDPAVLDEAQRTADGLEEWPSESRYWRSRGSAAWAALAALVEQLRGESSEPLPPDRVRRAASAAIRRLENQRCGPPSSPEGDDR
jgi:CRISPR-associated protein Csx10